MADTNEASGRGLGGRWRRRIAVTALVVAFCGAAVTVAIQLNTQDRETRELEEQMEAQAAAFSTDLDAVERELSSVDSAIGALQSDVSSIARALGQAGFGRDDLFDRMDVAEGQIRVLEDEVLDSNGGLATLMRQFAQRLFTLEQCVRSIESELSFSSSSRYFISCPI